MVYIPNYNVSKKEHEERSTYHATTAEALKASIERFDLSRLEKLNCMIELPDEVPMASNPKWANKRYGAVNTVERSGCLAMISKVICNHFAIDLSMKDILFRIEENGYRLWKLEGKTKTLNMPIANAIDIKEQFPEDIEMQKCKTLEEIYELYGQPVGIGGSMFFIDNFIKSVSSKIEIDTRTRGINKIFWNLDHNIPVPIRVENSIYQEDPEKQKEGHYVVLYGITKGQAIVIDSSWNQNAGVRTLPADMLLYAMIGNEKLVCAWDLESLA